MVQLHPLNQTPIAGTNDAPEYAAGGLRIAVPRKLSGAGGAAGADPGPHVVVATRDGKEVFRREVTGEPGAEGTPARSPSSASPRSTAIDEYKATCETRAGCNDDLRAPVRRWEAVAFTSVALSAASFGAAIYLFAKPSRAAPSVAIGFDASSVTLAGSVLMQPA